MAVFRMTFPDIPNLYWITFLGGFTAQVVHKAQSKSSFSLLAALNFKAKRDSPPLMAGSDLLTSALLTSTVAYCFSEPINSHQAISAGLGFANILSTIKPDPKS